MDSNWNYSIIPYISIVFSKENGIILKDRNLFCICSVFVQTVSADLHKVQIKFFALLMKLTFELT